MNINDFVKAHAATQYLGAGTSTQATSGLSLVAQAGLKKADQCIRAQVDTTTAQRSTFGKLQSAVSGAQMAARGLGVLGSSSTAVAQKADPASVRATLNQRSSILKSQQATLNALGQGTSPRW